jgi:hypothetical protein
MVKIIWMIILISVTSINAQDFFIDDPDTIESDKRSANHSYELNGFTRSVLFGGKVADKDAMEMKAGYGELGLKMRIRKGKWGDGIAEIRFRRGSEFNKSISEFNLREAYVNTYLGNFDFSIGHQIVVWGRADGFNPTNNITPQNMLARSPDEDDRREGNFLMRALYHFYPLRLEVIWVPQYSPSVLPTELFPVPSYITLGEAMNPDGNLENSSIAIKTDLELSKLDGSVSYFRGYMPMPAISLLLSSLDFTELEIASVTIVTNPYKMQVFGCDFSTTLGSFGLRGEVAYRDPIDDYQSPENIANMDLLSFLKFVQSKDHLHYIPNPDLQYVLGVDKTRDDFSIILQYIGRYVIDFKEFQPMNFELDELIIKNRMIVSQQDEMSHAVFIRPALTLLHETMTSEILAYYNITTEEILLRPLLVYQLTDALTLKFGGEWYSGPENTLFGTIDEALSSVFLEVKTSF